MQATFEIDKSKLGIIKITTTNSSARQASVVISAIDLLGPDPDFGPESVGLIRVSGEPTIEFLSKQKVILTIRPNVTEMHPDAKIDEDTIIRIWVPANQTITVRLFLSHRAYIKRSDNPLFKQWSFAIKGDMGDEIVFESGEKEMNRLLDAIRKGGAEVSVFEIQQQSKRIKFQ